MALSQVQCLDDNHVNWPLQESKPEFLYSEDQRLAVEALINGGRKAFQEFIQEHDLRPFLSELEQNQLIEAETYQPESEGDGVEGCENGTESSNDTESLQYWPDRSEDSIPELDIGWPERVSYRGVTRVSVYTQPPMEGQTHIKEIVRKTISLAQKVIAVAMDLFTDVDIFKDLLDASFKRKVSVYIVLEATGVPHFLDMCERAAMHRGHLKNLRVRCTRGIGFCTRSLRKVRGQLSQKFMFVDGDRAVSGSYSYTWMASRMDRNLVTVLTGQTVETFDTHFRELYLQSEGVNLSKISLGAEPEPEPAPQLVAPPTLPAARKLVNRFYTLVCTDMDNANAAQDAAAAESPEVSGTRTNGCPEPEVKAPQPLEEAPDWPPLHPGLVGLEPVDMFDYLPTWPDPEPPKNVIGFINIRDSNRPVQSHLMRSEQFEISQPISFKDPLVLPEEPLPEKACPRSNLRNPRTPNGPSTTEPPGGQAEGKEVPGISETTEELCDHLTSAINLCTTNTPGAHRKSEDISSISSKSEEHCKNLGTSNSTSTKDAKGVVKEAIEVPSISTASEKHQENLGTPNHPGSKNAQQVPEEGKDVPSMPVISEEHQENPESTLPVANGPVQPEVHSQADDSTAQASQPLGEQQQQKQPHPQQADRALPTSTQQKQEKEQTDRRKVTQTASSNTSHQQGNQARVPAKTTSPRLDSRSHPPNLAGAMTGGHTLWQGQQLGQGRAGRGGPAPRDQPYGLRGSLSSQHSQTSHRQPQAPRGRARASHQAPPAHRPPGPHGDGRTPPGQLFTRHSHLRTMNGAVPEAQTAPHRRTPHRQPGPGAAPGHRWGFQHGHHSYPMAMYNH